MQAYYETARNGIIKVKVIGRDGDKIILESQEAAKGFAKWERFTTYARHIVCNPRAKNGFIYIEQYPISAIP